MGEVAKAGASGYAPGVEWLSCAMASASLVPAHGLRIEPALRRFIKACGAMPLRVRRSGTGECGARGRMFGRFASSQCVLESSRISKAGSFARGVRRCAGMVRSGGVLYEREGGDGLRADVPDGPSACGGGLRGDRSVRARGSAGRVHMRCCYAATRSAGRHSRVLAAADRGRGADRRDLLDGCARAARGGVRQISKSGLSGRPGATTRRCRLAG